MRYWIYRIMISTAKISALIFLYRRIGATDEVTTVLFIGFLIGILLVFILDGGVAIINALRAKVNLPLDDQTDPDEKPADFAGILFQYLVFAKKIERNPSIQTNQRNFITFILALCGVYFATSTLFLGISDDEIRFGVLLSFCWITSYGGAVFLSKKIDERIRRIS